MLFVFKNLWLHMLQDAAKHKPQEGNIHSVAVSLLSNALHSSSDLLHVLFTFRQVVDSKDQARFRIKLDHPLKTCFGSLNYCVGSVVYLMYRV